MFVKDLTKRLAIWICGTLTVTVSLPMDRAMANEYDALLGDWVAQARHAEPVERGLLLDDPRTRRATEDHVLASSTSQPAATQAAQQVTSQPLKYDHAPSSVVHTAMPQGKPVISPVVDLCDRSDCGPQSLCSCSDASVASGCDDCSACDACPRCESPCYPMPQAACHYYNVKSCLQCKTCGILLTPVHCKTGTKQNILGESDCRPHTPPCLPTSSFLQYFRSKPAYANIWSGYAEETRSRCRNTDPHLHGYVGEKKCQDSCECGLLLNDDCGCSPCGASVCEPCDSGTCSAGAGGCSSCN
ncbi:MAG: hypothetical protein AAGD07_12850 [Planctomycetota bacterium]